MRLCIPYYKIEHLTDAAPLYFYVNQDGREIPGSPLDLSGVKFVPPQREAMADELSWDTEFLPSADSLNPDPSVPFDAIDSEEEATRIAALEASGLFDQEVLS